MKTQSRKRNFRILVTICVLGGLLMPGLAQAKNFAAPFNPLSLSSGVTAYAINLFGSDPAQFVSFSLSDPGSLTEIKTTSKYIRAATFLVYDTNRMYVLINSINTLSWIDTASGLFTTVGKVTPQAGEVWSGLTASTDGTVLYAVSTTPNCDTTPGGHSSLYTLSSNNGVTTYIGPVSSVRCLWGIAASPTVNIIFGVDVGLQTSTSKEIDHMITIDPGTGNSTDLGAMGDCIGIPGGLTFERPVGNLYLVSSIDTDSKWHLFSLNNFYSGTPFLTDTGTFPVNSDIAAMAIPIPDVPGEPPDKIAPVNGALVLSTHPKLSWQPTGVSDYFEYCITTTATSSGTDCDTGWKDIGLNKNSIQLPGLNAGQTYFWQVMAGHAGGTEKYGNGGAWWSFTTAAHISFLPLINR